MHHIRPLKEWGWNSVTADCKKVMTRITFDALKKEYEKLSKKLSKENSEDDFYRVKTEKLYEMKEAINDAEIIDDMEINTEKVSIGTAVELEFLGSGEKSGEKMEISILGSWDFYLLNDVNNLPISPLDSPLVRGIIGKKVGEEAEIHTKSCLDKVKIHSISSLF